MTDADRPRPGPTIDWGTGHYETTAAELEPVARRVVEMARIASGEGSLDLAWGTANAALLAAAAGASVTGLDVSARLLGIAAARAAAENLHVHWQTGELHDLAFPDESFELALSILGVIFAADPQRAISEIVRVLIPGGRGLITIWVPEGGIDAAVGWRFEPSRRPPGSLRSGFRGPIRPPSLNSWHGSARRSASARAAWRHRLLARGLLRRGTGGSPDECLHAGAA